MIKPVVSNTSAFIYQLPAHLISQIKQDIEHHAQSNGYTLEIDEETNDYIALSGRFCDIEEIYI